MTEIMSADERKARLAERKEQHKVILSMRLAGASSYHISDVLGISPGAVDKAISKHLEAASNPDAPELRRLEAERLDRLQVAIWPKAVGGNLQAVDSFLKISQRRSKLLGLDAPIRIDVSIRQEMEDALQALQQVVLGEVLSVEDHERQTG